MKYATALEKYETLATEPLSTTRALPGAPFPRKYVHSVFVNLQDARKAAQTLRAAGFDEHDIYVLEGSDLVEAMSRSQTLLGSLTSMDYDAYLREASRGSSFLVLRPANYAQLEQIRHLLVLHHAHLAKYIDTWTVAELLP